MYCKSLFLKELFLMRNIYIDQVSIVIQFNLFYL